MSDPAYALQIGMAAALLADPTVTSLVGTAVYDSLSAVNVPYPFIEIGDDQVLSEGDTMFDSSEVYSNVHIWSNGPNGRLVGKLIAQAVRNVLQNPFALTGHVIASASLHNSRFMIDGDPTDQGQVSHVVMTFQYHTTPTA
jgi:hypothetical protein